MCNLLVISIFTYICTADLVTSDFDHDLVSSGFSILDALIYFCHQFQRFLFQSQAETKSMEEPTPKLLMIMLLGVHLQRNQLLLVITLLVVHRKRNQLLQLIVMR